MIPGIPESANIRQQLPKKAFYEKFDLKYSEKTLFDKSVHRMSIVAEISPRTVNIAPGETIKSFFIIEVMLQSEKYDKKSIELLFRRINQNIVLILKYDKKCRLAVFKEMLIQGEWFDEENLRFNLNGLNLDTVWEEIVKTIGNIEIKNGNTLEEQIFFNAEQEKLNQQIETMDKKMRSEKQPRKKYEMHKEIQRLREKRI